AAITLANPRAAANRIADALLSSSVFTPHAPTSLTATFRQGVLGYTGAVDTYIDAGNPTTSNATNVLLTTDGVPPANEERQTLIRFDNIFGNGAGQIPVGSTINSATLTFNVSNGTLQ